MVKCIKTKVIYTHIFLWIQRYSLENACGKYLPLLRLFYGK